MGCDIHAFVEYCWPNQERVYWRSLSRELRLDRDYDMFAHMAGVRNYTNVTPISEPRGRFDGYSYEASNLFWLYVSDSKEDSSYVPTSKAASWVEQGISEYKTKERLYVSDPEIHSISWLTFDEFEKCIKERSKGLKLSDDYGATLEAMRYFEETGHKTRIVFGFDN